ncbi:MAG TPA: 30S ribosomal protein S9 [Candidatus Omnitrophota bacterium]|nr:30S ribosomal protein S9 [Candidatus Omnitrophota bacterium]
MSDIISATGRRKRSIARVWIFPGQKGFTINGQASEKYLKRANLQMVVDQPIEAVKPKETLRIRARVQGGGIAGQAGAVRLGISRALVKLDEKFQPTLRKGGFLTRDPRQKERKKYGKKGARRGFQFTKR